MTHYVPVKLTSTERDLLDWLVAVSMCGSRSGALRLALREAAERRRVSPAEVAAAEEERQAHPARTTRRAMRASLRACGKPAAAAAKK